MVTGGAILSRTQLVRSRNRPSKDNGMTNVDFSTRYALSRKELLSFDGRLDRSAWLQDQLPTGDFFFVQDAPLTTPLFQEAIMCFINGQFIASIVLGFSVIDRSLAARLDSISVPVPRNANELLGAAKKRGWLSDDEFSKLDAAREYRNPVIHFRNTLDPSRPDIRALPFGKDLYTVLEQDAKHVLCAAIHILDKTTI